MRIPSHPIFALLACFALSLNALAERPICRYVFDNTGAAKDTTGHHPEMRLSRGAPEPDYDKGGIRLDDATMSTKEITLTNAFTVCVWVRPIAFGKKAMNRNWPNGMIASCGSGYYDGWRLVIQEKGRFRPVFEIGRKEGSVSVTSSQGLSTSTWHMVAATWIPGNSLLVNREAAVPRGQGVMRLYVDGKMVAESSKPMPPPLPPKAPLNIGYTDFGVGSMLMDFAELSVYDRTMSSNEIESLFGARNYEQNLASPFDRAEMLGFQAMAIKKTFPGVTLGLWKKISEDESVDIIHRIIAAEKTGGSKLHRKLLESPEAPEFLKMRHEVQGFRKSACTLVGAVDAALPEKRIFVSTTGNDAGTGSESSPFASLERARDEVRKLKADGFQNQIAVLLSAGRYPRTSTFSLDATDAAAEGAGVVYAAKPGDGDVVIDGGMRLAWDHFRKVTDEATLALIPAKARGKVFVTDLPSAAEKPARQKSFGVGESPRSILMLSAEDQNLMHPARWPNEGFIHATNDSAAATGLIPLEGDYAKRWMSAKAPMAHGYWMYTWADAALPVAFAVTNGAYAFTLGKTHTYGLGKTPYFYLFNMLEALDAPGEWFYDDESAKLYLMPLEGTKPEYLTLTAMETPLVEMNGAHHIEFRGISFRNSRSDGVKLRNATNVAFRGCDFRFIGGMALVAGECDALTLRDSAFMNMGHGAVEAGGGDRRTLRPGHVRIHGNRFSKVGQFARTYTPGIIMHGVGAVICHNECFDMPSSAMRIEGNDHIIEFNRIHDVVLESDDQGAIDMWGDPSYRRCIFRYNLFQDIGNPEGAPCGQGGIRFDDAISGMIVHDNTFINASRQHFGAVQIHGGSHNVIYANTIQDCNIGVSFSPWGKERWLERVTQNKEYVDKIRLHVDITKPPYATRYPELARILQDFDHNFIWDNSFIRCGNISHNMPVQTEVIWSRTE